MSSTTAAETASQPVTLRGLLVGAVMCAVIAVGIPYGAMV